MSTEIRPNEVIDLDQQTVERYSLPEEEDPVLWIEADDTSYSVKWRVSDEFDADDQVGVLEELGYEFGLEELTVQQEGEEFQVDPVLFKLGDDYLSDSTYLRVELDEFDVEWLPGDYSNRVVYSSTFDRERSLSDFYDLLESTVGQSSRPMEKAVEQLNQVVAETDKDSSDF